MRIIRFMSRSAPAVLMRKSGTKCSRPSRSGPTRPLRMADRILVLYGSYCSNRMGIRLADFIVAGMGVGGESVELVDEKMVGLPMLDRMYKEPPAGSAPLAMEALAGGAEPAGYSLYIRSSMGRPTI